MKTLRQQLEESLTALKAKFRGTPPIAVILGSGLGPFADELEDAIAIDCREIPHYPAPTVPGHRGRWVWGKVNDVEVLAIQGRVHAYEGYSLEEVTYPVRLVKGLGAKILIVTNASGGINPHFEPGDLMLITDHINFRFDNPLIGPNDPGLGPRFPDLSEPYDRELTGLAERAALDLRLRVHRGVYLGTKGPTYETPAEVQMMRRLGAEAVGMSTVPEVIAAKHAGLRVLGISCITNRAAGLSEKKLTHEEVVKVAERAREKFTALVREVIRRIGET